MKYVFVDESWDDYLYWQKTDKKILLERHFKELVSQNHLNTNIQGFNLEE